MLRGGKQSKTRSLQSQVSEKGEIFSEFSERGQNVGLYKTRFSFRKGHFAMGPKRDPNSRTVRTKLLERHAFVILTRA